MRWRLPTFLAVLTLLLGAARAGEAEGAVARLGEAPAEMVLVGTVDGMLHGVAAETGEVLWQFHTGSPLLSSHTHPSVERLIPSVDGSLYLLDSERGRLERVGLDIQELVQRAPTLTPEHAWTGSKTARLFVLELATGRVVREVASDFRLGEQHPAPGALPHGPGLVLMGRADYVVKGSERRGELRELWNMSFGKYIADVELESSDDASPVVFEVGAARTLVARARDGGGRLWAAELGSQPAAIYRVVHDGASGDATVVELTARSERKELIGASKKSGVHVLRHADQFFAVPEEAYVSPLYAASLSAEDSELTPLIKAYYKARELIQVLCFLTFLQVRAGERTPLLAPGEDEVHEVDELVEQLEEEESWRSGGWGRWLASVGLGGLLVAAFVLLRRWQKSGKKKKSIVVAEAPVIAAAAAVPALQKMSVSETVLGYGSCGTVVYEGRLDNRRIAVKRMLREFYALAERECDILLRGDSHPNVVSYFLKEEDSRFVYLALSYCSLTLGELFGEERQEGEGVAPVAARPDAERAREFALADTVRLLHQVASGLAHLHALGVVHRDLKPANILIDEEGHAKISDMGLARRVDSRNHSFSTLSSGTVGYQAPEALQQRRQTAKVDVWGFGCLVYFVLSRGGHPFGPRVQREANVLNHRCSFAQLRDPVALQLVAACIAPDSSARPEMAEIVRHPLFWDKHRRLLFLLDVSDLLEALEGNAEATLDFERHLHKHVLGWEGRWQKMISQRLLGDMGKYRRYQNTVKDLLRLIRNKSHHYRELSPELQEQLGAHPDGYLDYFAGIFPKLFIRCYMYIRNSKYRTESAFKRYFEQ